MRVYCGLDSSDEERENCLKFLGEKLLAEQLQVMTLVDFVGKEVSTADPSTRTRSSLLLFNVLDKGELPLTSEQVHGLVEFIAGRVQDSFSTQSAVQALGVLLQRYTVTVEDACKVAIDLFAIQAGGLAATTRRQMLLLGKVLWNNRNHHVAHCDIPPTMLLFCVGAIGQIPRWHANN